MKTKFYFFIPVLVFLLGCVKNQNKKGPSTVEDKSVQFSIDVAKAVSTSVSAVKDSISAVNSAKSVRTSPTENKMITSRMVTGRVITSRAPRIKQSNFAYCPAFTPRLKQQQEGGGCYSEDETYLSTTFPDCTSFGINGECAVYIEKTSDEFNGGNIYLSLSSLNYSHSDEFTNNSPNYGYTYVCPSSQISLSCENIQQSYEYLVQNFSNCITKSYSKFSDDSMCFYYEEKEFAYLSYNYSGSSGNYHNIYITPQNIDTTYCETNGACSFTSYSCPENSINKDLCDKDINYLQGLTKNCKISYIGVVDNQGCSVYDWDNDGQPDEVYFSYGEKSFSFWINDSYAEGKYLMYSECYEKSCTQHMSSYKIGEGNCSFNISCDSFDKSVTNVVNILKEKCKLEKIGFYSYDNGKYQSCMKGDFTGDGKPDIAIDEWEDEKGISFIGEKDGKAEKIECKEDSCTYYYAQNCKIQEGSCEIPENCNWEKVGEDWGTKGCVDIDINNDSKKEKILYIYDSDIEETLIASEEKFVYISCPNLDRENSYHGAKNDSEYCTVKVGNCKLEEECPDKEALTHNYVKEKISNCSLSDHPGKCDNIDECGDMIYGLFEGKTSENSCSIVLNSKTGEFIKIKKVDGGYEYTKGSTEGLISISCPLDSKVDFKSCSISGCKPADDKSADFITKLTDFVENATKQVYTLRLSDSKRGINGTITVEYYNDSGTMSITGMLETPGGTIDVEAYLNEDSSMTVKFSLTTPEGRVVKGKFSISSDDGSGEGEIIDSDGNTYRVVLRADGTYEICDSSGRCSS